MKVGLDLYLGILFSFFISLAQAMERSRPLSSALFTSSRVQNSAQLYYLGKIEYKKGNTPIAQSLLEELVRLPVTNDHESAIYWYKLLALHYLGRIAYEAQDFITAERCWSLAVRSGYAFSSTCNLLGLLFFKKKEYTKAYELFTAAANKGSRSGIHNKKRCLLFLERSILNAAEAVLLESVGTSFASSSSELSDSISIKDERQVNSAIAVSSPVEATTEFIEPDMLEEVIQESNVDSKVAVDVPEIKQQKKRKKTKKKHAKKKKPASQTETQVKEPPIKNWTVICSINTGQSNKTCSPFLSTNNKYIITTLEREIRFTELLDPKKTVAYRLPEGEQQPLALASFNEKTERIYGFTYQNLYIWELNKPEVPAKVLTIPRVDISQGCLTGIAISSCCSFIALAYDNFAQGAARRSSLTVWHIKHDEFKLYKNIGLRFPGLPKPVRYLQFSADSSKLCLLAGPNTVFVYSFSADNLDPSQFNISNLQYPLLAYFNHKATQVALRLDDKIAITELKVGKKSVQVLVGHKGPIYSVDFSPDDKLIATASHDNTIKIWDTTTGECLSTLFDCNSYFGSVRFSSCGQLLISEDALGKVNIWQFTEKENTGSPDSDDSLTVLQLIERAAPGTFTAVALDFLLSRSYSAVEGTIIVRSLKTKEDLAQFKAHESAITALCVDPVQHTLISAGRDCRVKIWDASNCTCKQEFSSGSAIPTCLYFDKNKGLLYVGTNKGTILVWSVKTNLLVYTFNCSSQVVTALTISQRRNLLIVGYNNGTVELFNIKDSTSIQKAQVDNSPLANFCFNKKESLLISGTGSGIIGVYKIKTGKLVYSFKAHEGAINDLLWNENKKQLMSLSKTDSTLKYWSLETGACLYLNQLPENSGFFSIYAGSSVADTSAHAILFNN